MDEHKEAREIPDEVLDDISGGRRSGAWEPTVTCTQCGSHSPDLIGDTREGYLMYRCRYCKNEFKIDLDHSGAGEPKVIYL